MGRENSCCSEVVRRFESLSVDGERERRIAGEGERKVQAIVWKLLFLFSVSALPSP